MDLRQELFNNQDLAYKDFHKKLIPTVDENLIIGVRIPVLRKLAKQAHKENAYNACEYYEEIMLKGFTLGLKKCSLDEHIEDLKTFVKQIDNWAVCDCCCSSFKFTEIYLDEMFDFIVSFVGKSEYETRFAVVMLMDYYLNDKYIQAVIDILINIASEEYYVNMAVAWALSVVFVKYQDLLLPVIKSKTLSKDVQNKTIQKIKDSLRVDKETKQMLNQYIM